MAVCAVAARGGTWRGVVRGRAVYTAVIHLAHAVRLTLLFLVRSLPYPGLPVPCLRYRRLALPKLIESFRARAHTAVQVQQPVPSSMRSRRWDRFFHSRALLHGFAAR